MSLPVKTRILIFFASNYKEQLTTAEMVRKFEAPRQTILNQLAELEDEELISLERKHGVPGNTALFWSAGSALLDEL